MKYDEKEIMKYFEKDLKYFLFLKKEEIVNF